MISRQGKIIEKRETDFSRDEMASPMKLEQTSQIKIEDTSPLKIELDSPIII